MLDQIQNVIERTLSPVVTQLSQSAIIRSMSTALMRAMPVLLGAALFSLLADFPISQVTDFLANIGILENIRMVVHTLNNLNPIMFIALYCYTYAQEKKVDPIPNLLFGVVIYFMFMPTVVAAGDQFVPGYSFDYFAGNGMFVALFAGILISLLYVFLINKKITFKLPESVPPMVAKSFEPIFVGMIIIGLFLLLDYGIGLTSYGNMFTFIQEVIQAPIVAIGANIPFMILYFTLINLLWFFGVHPSALLALYIPVVRVMFSGNIGAAMQGLPLPYAQEYLTYMVAQIGGAGNLLALGLIMLFFSKSRRFKETSKIAAVPVIFNINEPIVFGTPIVLNSAFFIPMVLSAAVSMGAMYFMTSMIPVDFNALSAMAIPWTMPWPITAFIAGGVPLFTMMMIVIGLNVLLYFPFFLIADKKALKEEQELLERK